MQALKAFSCIMKLILKMGWHVCLVFQYLYIHSWICIFTYFTLFFFQTLRHLTIKCCFLFCFDRLHFLRWPWVVLSDLWVPSLRSLAYCHYSGENVCVIIYISDLMRRSEILWESLMFYKIPGQSCKINDLFCYLMSSSTVERLDLCDSYSVPVNV